MDELVQLWPELAVICALISAISGYNYKFRRNSERHDETSDRIDKHEKKCEEQYKTLDEKISDVHEKINDVATITARIEGILSERKKD